MFAQFVKKNVLFVILIFVAVTIALFNYGKIETQAVLPKPMGFIGEEIEQTEFIQGDKFTPQSDEKIHPQGRLIHNNGKPIKNDVLTYGGDQKLFAVFQMVTNADNEYYIFSPLDEMDMDEIRKDVLEKQMAIERLETSKDDY